MNTRVFFNTTTKLLVASLLVATVLLVATTASSKRHLREGAGRSLQWGAMFEWVEAEAETFIADTTPAVESSVFEVGGAALGGADSAPDHLRAPGTASGSDLLEGGTPIGKWRPLNEGEFSEIFGPSFGDSLADPTDLEDGEPITFEDFDELFSSKREEIGSGSILLTGGRPIDDPSSLSEKADSSKAFWEEPSTGGESSGSTDAGATYAEPIVPTAAAALAIQYKTFDGDTYSTSSTEVLESRASSKAHGGNVYNAMEDHHHRHHHPYSVSDDNETDDATATAAAGSSSSSSDGSN